MKISTWSGTKNFLLAFPSFVDSCFGVNFVALLHLPPAGVARRVVSCLCTWRMYSCATPSRHEYMVCSSTVWGLFRRTFFLNRTVMLLFLSAWPGGQTFVYHRRPCRSAMSSWIRENIYDRPVPIRPSSFIRIAGILLKRLLLVVVDEFAEEGDEA